MVGLCSLLRETCCVNSGGRALMLIMGYIPGATGVAGVAAHMNRESQRSNADRVRRCAVEVEKWRWVHKRVISVFGEVHGGRCKPFERDDIRLQSWVAILKDDVTENSQSSTRDGSHRSAFDSASPRRAILSLLPTSNPHGHSFATLCSVAGQIPSALRHDCLPA